MRHLDPSVLSFSLSLHRIQCRTNDDRFSTLNGSRFYAPAWVFPPRFSWDLLNSVHETLFLMIFSEIISRRVKLSQGLLRFMTGWFTRCGHYSVPWFIGLRYTKLPRQLVKNEVILKSVKDYIVLQKPQAQDNHLPTPHTLVADFTMTYV